MASAHCPDAGLFRSRTGQSSPSTQVPSIWSRTAPLSSRRACMHVRLLCRTCAEQPAGKATAHATSASRTSDWSLEQTQKRLEGQRNDLHLVMVHPQIPQNAGNVARTCAGTGVTLHLVEPLGFDLDDKKLKRAGLDYWDSVTAKPHSSWKAFYQFFLSLPQPRRLVAFTVFGTQYYAGPEFTYQAGDWLVFGAETSGLPPEVHEDILASGGQLVKIPILDTHVRSLNLAVCAGVGVFEALRQLDAGKHQVAPRQSPSFEETIARYHTKSAQ